MMNKDEMHIDDWVNKATYSNDPAVHYAQFFFLLHRMPGIMQSNFRSILESYKLFCLYKGEEYRVMGASRLGDVWLSKDFTRDHGYELRVCVEACSRWQPHPFREESENWKAAVESMKDGFEVRRMSRIRNEELPSSDGVPVIFKGEEGVVLSKAYTHDGQEVLVFQGAGSGVLFEPSDEYRKSCDWTTVGKVR